MLDSKERHKIISIPDIPILLSDDGTIICIPKENEVSSIAICGASGTGKTLLLNRICSFLHYSFKDNVAIMNDVSEETYKWSEPMDFSKFNKFNKKLNQEPVASPISYVYPNTKDIEVKETDKSYVKTVLPFNEIIDDLGFWLKGVEPDFELGKSALYVNDLKGELEECETSNQVKETLMEHLPGQSGKSFQAMRIKILTAFESLFREEILDLTNPECHSELKVKIEGETFTSNPFSVLMKAGRIPSFITSGLQTKNYKSVMMAYYVNSIFQNHLKEFPGERTWLLFDELRTICEVDNDPAAKAIGQVSARGRINRVGLVYITQFYNKIPNCVKGAKLNYLIALSHSDDDIVREICNDFDLNKKVRKKITKLKKYEAIAMTKNSFTCYRDDKCWETQGPVFGQIFYPLANHHKAGEIE